MGRGREREKGGGDKEKGEREKGILYTHTPCSAIYASF